MKGRPTLFLFSALLVLSVGLFSCDQKENSPLGASSTTASSLLKPVKPTVTTTITKPDDSLSISVCVTPSSAVAGFGHLVLEKMVGFLGADSACGSPTEVQLDSFYVATTDDTCHTFRVLAPTTAGTYGYEGSFAPNRKTGNPRNYLSGDGDCENYVVPSLSLSQSPTTIPAATTGNGAPSGPHYNLNIIGVPKDKSASMDGNSGHRIFVKLDGTTKIWLSQGDFQVLDANGTDGDGAAFQLPNPDPDGDGTTEYSVYARALGKPGGGSTTTTCAKDTASDTWYCSTLQMVLVREKGKSSFQNVSKYLLYIYADINGDGTVDRVPLFDSRLEDYYWNYDNSGLKLAQLRFYEIPTTVPAP